MGIHHGEDGDEARRVVTKVTALAEAGQTLLTADAFVIACRGAVGQPEAGELSWRPHGRYSFESRTSGHGAAGAARRGQPGLLEDRRRRQDGKPAM